MENIENNSLLSKKENQVWQNAKKNLNTNDDSFITTLPKLMGALAAIIENRGFFGNLFKNRKTGILELKKYAKNIEKVSASFAIYDGICGGIKYLKNARNFPKGTLKCEHRLR